MFHLTTMPAKAPGRAPIYGKPLTESVKVLFTEDHLPLLEKRAGGKDISTWMRRIALGEEETPAVIINDGPALNTVRVPDIGIAPCGPLTEVIAQTSSFITLSRDVAKVMRAGEDDVFVTARGDSMKGEGIKDGQLVLMELSNRPARNDIVLVHIIRDGEIYESQIKKWDGFRGSNAQPTLLDGDGKPVKLPGDAKIECIAIAKSVMGRL